MSDAPKPGTGDSPPEQVLTQEMKQVLSDLTSPEYRIHIIHGGAGTGKSTFLSLIKSNPQHSTAVVAPTGIAAMNVEGQTIHSMFKLPPEIITNGAVRPLIDPDVIRSIDILIIDEISMVRADLFDAIDQSLRLNRKRWNTPFGGVKIVAFGDFYQLPPVVTDQDRDQMRNMGYTTEFFFSSRAFKQALQENQVAYHQFSTIFRQSDQMFIDVLNKVRAYTFDQEVATALNSRVIDQVEHAPKNSTILTTINRVANAHNNRELEKLPGAASSFTAEVTGKIADSEVPAVKELNLKVGAKVLFVKNNIPAWVNGSVGTVVQLPTSEPNESKPLLVRIDDKVVAVDRDVWEKKERKKVAGRMQDQVIGTFRQYPIKLGWAVTIHKSQGMTLPNAVIDTRVAAFAAGQVYVALSRCRSLDTLHLLSPITEEQILVDSRITTADAYIRRVSAKTKTEEIRRDARSALQEGRSPAQTASAFVVEHEPGVFTLSRSKIHKKPKGQKNREIER